MELMSDEQVLFELRPDKNVVSTWLITRAVPTAFLGAFAVFWCVTFFGGMWEYAEGGAGEHNFMNGITAACYGAIFFFLVGVLWVFLAPARCTYYVTSHRCVLKAGLVFSSERSVLYDQMT